MTGTAGMAGRWASRGVGYLGQQPAAGRSDRASGAAGRHTGYLVQRDSAAESALHRPGGRTGSSARQPHPADDRPHPAAQLISGMGGVGKTEIATEYIHLHRDKYEIIWWIRAEHNRSRQGRAGQTGAAAGIAAAGTEGGRDRTIAAVLEALAIGSRPNWLLVYDNAAQPLDLQRYLPTCPPGGHVIITSRLQNWPGYIEADSVEVFAFTEDEAISFLRRRVPALGADRRLPADEDERRNHEAGRLAEPPWVICPSPSSTPRPT